MKDLTTEDTEGTEAATPETDALILSKDGFGATRYEWAKHSRRLERERDEAREKYFAMRDLHTNATELAEKYKRERDEALAWVGEIFRLLDLPDGDMGALENCKLELEAARKTLSGIYRWIERHHQDGFIDSLTHEQNLDRVYDALYDRLDATISERDEAREALREIQAANWRTAGELRCMARRALEVVK